MRRHFCRLPLTKPSHQFLVAGDRNYSFQRQFCKRCLIFFTFISIFFTLINNLIDFSPNFFSKNALTSALKNDDEMREKKLQSALPYIPFFRSFSDFTFYFRYPSQRVLHCGLCFLTKQKFTSGVFLPNWFNRSVHKHKHVDKVG